MSRIFPTKEEKELARQRAQAAAVFAARLREMTMRVEAPAARRDVTWFYFRDEAERNKYYAKCIGRMHRVEPITVHNVKVQPQYVVGEKNPDDKYDVLYTVQCLNERGYNTPVTFPNKRK